MTESLIRLPALRAKLGLSRSTIYRLVAAGRFPAPIKLSPQTIAWKESEVEDWLGIKTEAKTENVPPGYVYVMRGSLTRLIKIGISANVQRRARGIEHATGQVMELLAVATMPSMEAAREFECELFNELVTQRRLGEWFELTDAQLSALLERIARRNNHSNFA